MAHAALFYFLREYCYSSMFRYNQRCEFNVPYGGMSYSSKAFAYRISSLTAPNIGVRLGKTSLSALDFDDFFRAVVPPQPNDFIFLDPPYDSAFSTYAQAPFDCADHQRLAAFCKTTKANFVLVIKNTDFIR